jgi:hypothetical protein
MSDGFVFDSDVVREALRGKRFLAADRVGLDISEIGTWDEYLLREHRLLVPIDVQAMYVEPGSAEKIVALPMLVAGPDGHGVANVEDGMPDPFTEGSPRAPGVHLHWAMPDALLRGTMKEIPDGSPNRLSLPVLPDRWVVLRVLLPENASDVVVTGWVIEADRAVAVPLGSWTEGGALPQGVTPQGETIAKDQLTGTVGGAISWSAVYDAVVNRFAFHDPLGDIAEIAPNGVDNQCAAYVVAGWWSAPANDPLDAARSDDSLHELLERLRWRLLYEWGDAKWEQDKDKAEFELRQALGVTSEERWSSKRPVSVEVIGDAAPRAQRAPSGTAELNPIESHFVQKRDLVATSVFATDTFERFVADPWHLRSSLLHGSIYGVPVEGKPPVDRRPAESALAVSLGQHDDDLLAAFATPSGATVDTRRSTERLLAAFTSQKIDRLASSDGLVELEEHEHASAFSSLPAGLAGTDRYLQRVQTGGVGGLGLGRARAFAETNAAKVVADRGRARSTAPAHARPAAQAVDGELFFAVKSKPNLVFATELMINDVARSRVHDVLSPTEARVVDRPAARFTFATEPMVAIRGTSRSLRHGGDGRGSADQKLTCRWPTHVISEIAGVVAPDRFVRSLGNGGVPREVITLAREAVLHDPYHDEWVARAVTPPGVDVRVVLNRLKAESLLRFGADGTYDGTTVAFNPTVARTPAARRRQAAAAPMTAQPGIRSQQVRVADALMKFSLFKGADPDLVGVTTWSQPWIPMWLEWEVAIKGVDPATLDAWGLGQIDLARASAPIDGDAAMLRGRALLTTGAATTLYKAIHDFIKAEEALDNVQAGLVDPETQKNLGLLAAAVEHLDVVTATLDGVRTQLLGLPVTDGLRRPADGAGVTNPAPVEPPRSLLAGTLTLTRARLLDAFGRTLEVPVSSVSVASRSIDPGDAAALSMTPRLLRPARWQYRLVDSTTAVGVEGTEARVDQIEPTLQVNPVAGFLMPDHLDESLEVFAVDGSPIGELLHEPVSGGVMWEIAAGRAGPADSGPNFGLTPSQIALGRFAAGLVAADAAARQGGVIDPDSTAESALSAFLRAIDTTLWTVDTFAAMGSEHVAGLVGRPVAVVRAQLRLEPKPPDDIDLSDPARAAEWAAAEKLAAAYAFPVRIGELTRSDDGVLGFFVDDDYSRFRIVDKVIASRAATLGRSRGQLGLYNTSQGMPAEQDLNHPYIFGTDDADTLQLHLGQLVTLTILMHPAGKASLTSGILPRKAVALARDWVGAGLAAIAPSLRTGPVLVETDLDTEGQVRLPKVSVFGKDQNFLWRDTPATWRTDAILAATQTALLPDTPAEFREGWIRVAPDKPKPSEDQA